MENKEYQLDDLITGEYANQNALLHGSRANYGRHAHYLFKKIRSIALNYEAKTMVDYGAGKGTLKIAFEVADSILEEPMNIVITEFDPAFKKLKHLPASADLIVCLDVMEHVEEDKVDNTISFISSITQKAAYFTISTRLSKKSLPNGQNAHITVHDETWWTEKLEKHFVIIDLEITRKGELRYEVVPKVIDNLVQD